MTTQPTPTERFARFAAGTTYDDLPGEVVHAVRRAVVDSLGVTVGGRDHETVRAALRAVRETGGSGIATVVGEERRADLHSATLVNGIMAHVLDWDDSIYPTRLHPSAALVPALLAAGEDLDASGRALVVGHAVGFEIARRLADAAYPGFYAGNWHGTGITGAAATAGAVGSMLGLDADRMVHALGVGAGLGAGTLSALGSSAKSLILGHAGSAGLDAAYLARQGFTAHPDMLGRGGGFLDLYASDPAYEGLTDGLGERWAVLDNGFKPYPCGMVAHAAIDAARELRALAPPRSRLAALRLRVSSETADMTGVTDPATGLQAKFSVRYEAAVAWVEGNVGPAAFEDDAVRRPEIREAMARTTVEAVERIAQQEAWAEAETADGWRHEVHVPYARGTVQRPLSDDDLDEKFRLACSTSAYSRVEELRESGWSVEELRVRELTTLLTAWS